MPTPAYQKLALILACNYYGNNRLYGCINDANNIKDFLIKRRGFLEENITLVYNEKMTAKNIWRALDRFREEMTVIAENGDTPAGFLYFSGHGVLLDPSLGTGGGDTFGNQALVPYDFTKADFIVDDDLFSNFIALLPEETELFIFTDCCNSGSNFDLAFTDGEEKAKENLVDAHVIHLGASRDDQTAAEVKGAGVATTRFLEIMGPETDTVEKLRREMADVSIAGHPQHPQVSVSYYSLYEQRLFSWLIEQDKTRQWRKSHLRGLVTRKAVAAALTGRGSESRKSGLGRFISHMVRQLLNQRLRRQMAQKAVERAARERERASLESGRCV